MKKNKTKHYKLPSLKVFDFVRVRNCGMKYFSK